MTDQPTPRTEAGLRYIDVVAQDELRGWWESLTYEQKWEAFVIEKHNAEAAAQAHTEALDVLSGLLSEVGFMRCCIASGERLNPDDLARQDGVMTRAVAIIKADR